MGMDVGAKLAWVVARGVLMGRGEGVRSRERSKVFCRRRRTVVPVQMSIHGREGERMRGARLFLSKPKLIIFSSCNIGFNTK